MGIGYNGGGKGVIEWHAGRTKDYIIIIINESSFSFHDLATTANFLWDKLANLFPTLWPHVSTFWALNNKYL